MNNSRIQKSLPTAWRLNWSNHFNPNFCIVITAAIANPIYSDEQSSFKCNTLQVGCENVCFNQVLSQIWTLWHGRVNFRFSDFPDVPNSFLDCANNFHLCANGYIYTVGYELGTLYERPYRPNTVRTRWWAKVHCNVTCFLVLFALYDFWRRTTNESRTGK